MTTIQGFDPEEGLGFDWDIGDLAEAEIVSANSTTVVLGGDGQEITFTGTFTIVNGEPTGGTITSFTVGAAGGPVFMSVSGFSMPFSQFMNYIDTDDGAGLLAFLLSGNDTITGSAADDELMGQTGDDTLNGGDGNDVVTYRTATSAVTVNLNLSGAQNTGDGNDTLISVEGIEGSAFNDTLYGDANNNWLFGGAGRDTLDGGPGDDMVYGGDGDGDYIHGGAGNDFIDGGAGGGDTLSFVNLTGGVGVTVNLGLTGPQNTGGAGTDTIIGIEGVTGSTYNDVLITGPNSFGAFQGFEGNDVIVGISTPSGYASIIDGGNGIDTFSLAPAASGVTVNLNVTTAQSVGVGTYLISNIENLMGSAFNDTFRGTSGNNILNGGNGIDTVSYVDATAGVTLDLSITTAQNTIGAGTDTLLNIENLTGSSFDDLISGNSGNNTLNGGSGTDTVSYANATAGVKVALFLLTAQDTVGAGTDTLSGFENLIGSAFNDELKGNSGNTTIDGGAGIDLVSYIDAVSGVTMNLSLTTAQATGASGNDTLLNIENLTGTNYNDTLTGSSADNVLTGAAGDDVINGGAGNDTIDGGLGNDVLGGGDGYDTLSYESATAGVTVRLTLTTAQNTGGAGTDTISGFEAISGSAFNDVLGGDGGDNYLYGGLGVDTVTYQDATAGVNVNLVLTGAQVTGGAGWDWLLEVENLTGSAFDDTLEGGVGTNVLTGGAGNDLLDGGPGADLLNGGDGRDTARYRMESSDATWTHNPDGSWTVTSLVYGADTLTGVEVLRFNDRDVVLGATRQDFNADGLSDLLWRNNNGTVDAWLTTPGADYDFIDANQGVIDTAWTISQTGDFNGDGKGDFLWRHSSGNTNVWLSNAGTGMAGFTGQGLGDIATAWQIQESADFNGDGKDDVVWRNSDGTVNIWASNAGSGYTGFTGEGFGTIDNAWTIKGADDFNGDGRADMLWRHSSGAVNIWLSNTTSGPIGFTGDNLGVIPTNWTIQDTGDFNGDGKADILWRNAAGNVNLWLSNSGSGFTGLTGNDLGAIPTDWLIKDVADYNGDGKADIAWRHTDGSVNIWMSNTGSGFTGLTGQYVGAVPNDWFIV